jgi:hypothetical protein
VNVVTSKYLILKNSQFTYWNSLIQLDSSWWSEFVTLSPFRKRGDGIYA